MSTDVVLADGQFLQMPAPEDMTDSDRPYWAYKLKMAAWDWAKVAEAVGYSGAVSAAVSVRAYVQREAARVGADQRAEILQLEHDRLEALIEAYWPLALSGDHKSAELVLKVVGQQIKLYNLDAEQDRTVEHRTLVISGSSEEFIEKLKAFA